MGGSTLRNVNTTETNGVPSSFSKTMALSKNFNIVKGSLNKLRLRSSIQNEHQESSREALSTVTNLINVGQFFKASCDNINGIALTLQSAETFASFDTITAGAGENKAGTIEYTSDAALQAEYIKTGLVEAVRSAYTDQFGKTQDNNWALKLPMDTLADKWGVTLTSTDLTGFTFSLKYAATEKFSKGQIYFYIGDGTNTKSYPLTINQKDEWVTFTFSEASMTVTANDLTVVTPNMAAITTMGFRIDLAKAGNFGYVDTITFQTAPLNLKAQLWDFGTTLPANNGTIDYTVAGTQYTELGDRGIGGNVLSSINIELEGGKKLYHIDNFIAGVADEIPTNTKLTKGNYYAIVLSYVDTDVTVYGADTTNSISYYNNGYAWDCAVADNLIDIIPGAAGVGAYSDLMFQIFSTQETYCISQKVLVDVAPDENTHASIFFEDSGMKITDIIAKEVSGGFGLKVLEFPFIKKVPMNMKDGGKAEVYYNDGGTDVVSKAQYYIEYKYEPPKING